MEFKELKLNEKLLRSIEELGYKEPTGIQAKCIPLILEGKDVVGQSLTGSGKTAAFGLPIMQNIVPGNGIQALVLTPTRELCSQVTESLLKMSKYYPINIAGIYGGVGFYQQVEDVRNAEMIVATPGRLLDHINRRNVGLRNVKFMVLDEADRMLDMGFEEDVEKIFSYTNKSRQTVLFSATMPDAAKRLIHKYLKNPIMIKEQLYVDRSLLKQSFYSLNSEFKFSLLVHLIKSQNTFSAIVFCGTKRTVDKIARNLRSQKIDSMPIHGDLTQSKRTQAVNALKNGKIDVLVATDVAARGLDIDNITHIYNYDVPRTPEEYVHRIGRTARAGKSGEAITLVSERDYKAFNEILKEKNLNIVQATVPDYEKLVLKRDFGHDNRDGYQNRTNYSDRTNYSQQGYGQRNNFHGTSRRDFVQGNYSQRDSYRPQRSRQEYGGSSYSRPYGEGTSNNSNEAYSNRQSYPHPRPSHSFHKPKPSFGGHSHSYSQSAPSSYSNRNDSYSNTTGQERTPRTYAPYKRNESYSKAPSKENFYSKGQSNEKPHSRDDSHSGVHFAHKGQHSFGKKKKNFQRKRF